MVIAGIAPAAALAATAAMAEAISNGNKTQWDSVHGRSCTYMENGFL
jgi:hypothetical protein